MQLRNEINAPNTENIFHQTLVNLIFTYHWSSQQIKAFLVPFDITQQQYNVLKIVSSQHPNPSTINLIRSRILDKMSDASRIVDRLVQKGFVEKKANANDKRAVDIMLSKKGLALLKKIEKEVDFSSCVAPKITVDEAIQLNLLLDKVRG